MTPAEGQQASAESKQGPTSQKSAIDPNNPEEQGDAQAQSERGAASGDQKSGDEQGKPGDQASGGEQSQQQDAQNKGNQAGSAEPEDDGPDARCNGEPDEQAALAAERLAKPTGVIQGIAERAGVEEPGSEGLADAGQTAGRGTRPRRSQWRAAGPGRQEPDGAGQGRREIWPEPAVVGP